jgi:hypothetical protein
MESKMQSETKHDPVGYPASLDEHQRQPGRPWHASAMRRLPWDAILAFFGAIASAILMIVVIFKSNNDPVSNWPVAPAVYLAIISVGANIQLRYAFSRGVEISWWVAAMEDNTKVKHLHNIWLYGTSLKSAFFAGRSFNLVALAAILLALVPANGPLAQRASQPVTRITTAEMTVPLVAAPTLGPGMTTGQITGRSAVTSYVTPSFAKVLQNHLVSAPITVSEACGSGTCRGVVRAAGYAVSCVSGSRLFDKVHMSDMSDIGPDGKAADEPSTIFGAELLYVEEPNRFAPGQSAMNLSIVFKADGGCSGALTLRSCTLTPATLEYRVVVANASIALDSAYTYENDSVASHYETPGAITQHDPSYHGGLALALQNMFKSEVTMKFGGPVGQEISTRGVTGMRYHREKERDTTTQDVHNACLSYWLDPTHDLLMTVREIAFRLAFQTNVTGVAVQEMRAERLMTELVFQSDYVFLGLALMLIGVSALAVVPLLLKWWRLGRAVSLSPIEVARAFGAPELVAGSGSNSSLSELMKEVGSRKVRYGQVVYGENSGPTAAALAFAHPTMVQPPEKGAAY